jgi:hypothetical protein
VRAKSERLSAPGNGKAAKIGEGQCAPKYKNKQPGLMVQEWESIILFVLMVRFPEGPI